MFDQQNFPVRRALISVSDKTGLASFARSLQLLGIEIISTGGTATYLRDHGIPVISVSEITNFPEILEGRAKTLHPAVHGGILANLAQSSHRDALASHSIAPIGLVVINLYPFEKTARDSASSVETIIENIDIGGPALLRASAKNHAFVDGNKRVSFIAAGLFLRLNGWRLKAEQAEATLVMLSVASSAMSEDELASWIGRHIVRA